MYLKKYQRLREPENLAVAREVYYYLKENKAMSQEKFDSMYQEIRGYRFRHGAWDNLTKSTREFLITHGIMTREMINGFIVYAVTRRCVYTKSFENAIREYEVVTGTMIEEAKRYISTNDGMVPYDVEAGVIARKILKLEGKENVQHFVNTYRAVREYFDKMGTKREPYAAFLNVITYTEELKIEADR